MPGFCTSVRTVTHSKEYGQPARCLIVDRAPTPDDVNQTHFRGHLQAAPHGSAGPCGSVARLADSGGWVWAYLLDQINDYRMRWGHKPLGDYYRAQGARSGRPRGLTPQSFL